MDTDRGGISKERAQAISQKVIDLRARIDVAVEKLVKAVDEPTSPVGADARKAAGIAEKLRTMVSGGLGERPISKNISQIFNKIEAMKKRSGTPAVRELLDDAEKWFAVSFQEWWLKRTGLFAIEDPTEIRHEDARNGAGRDKELRVPSFSTGDSSGSRAATECERASDGEDLEELPVIEDS
jgi:hypothetical protein